MAIRFDSPEAERPLHASGLSRLAVEQALGVKLGPRDDPVTEAKLALRHQFQALVDLAVKRQLLDDHYGREHAWDGVRAQAHLAAGALHRAQGKAGLYRELPNEERAALWKRALYFEYNIEEWQHIVKEMEQWMEGKLRPPPGENP